jgi:HEAT repeat protein
MLPQVLKALLMAAATAGPGLIQAMAGRSPWKRKGLAKVWRETAEACGLTDVRWTPSPLGGESDLTAQSRELPVRFHVTGRGAVGTRIAIGDHGADRAHSLTLRRETGGTALRKRGGFREIEIGDPDFDEAVFIVGPPTLARAVLDVETRRIVRDHLFEVGIRRSHGDVWLKTTEAACEAGEVRVAVEASSASDLGQVLPDVLRRLRDIARRLVTDDVAVRLAHTAREEPVAEARLQDLLTLAREFPEHAATRVALRAALKDDEDEIRLRCAVVLEEEGFQTLLDMASDHRTLESCAVRAIVAVGDRLSLKRTGKILTHALKTRRLLVAAAVLEALGRRGTPETIPTIAGVLRQESGEMGVAAVRALALSGLPAAEAPLMEALARDGRNIRLAAAQALGRVGSAAAVPALKETRAGLDEEDFERSARHAIVEIQSRVRGGTPGALSLTDAGAQKAGQLTLADDEAGRLSLSEKPPS